MQQPGRGIMRRRKRIFQHFQYTQRASSTPLLHQLLVLGRRECCNSPNGYIAEWEKRRRRRRREPFGESRLQDREESEWERDFSSILALSLFASCLSPFLVSLTDSLIDSSTIECQNFWNSFVRFPFSIRRHISSVSSGISSRNIASSFTSFDYFLSPISISRNSSSVFGYQSLPFPATIPLQFVIAQNHLESIFFPSSV